MSDKPTGDVGLLMRCYEALHNWQALSVLAGGVVIGLGLVVAGMYMLWQGHDLLSLPVFLIALLVYLAGINGAGLLLVDQADGRPGRGFAAAFFGGLGATFNMFLALLLLALGLVVVVAVLYVLGLLGKIPGVGPLFAFLLAGPSAVVLMFCYGILAIGVPLLMVAVWRGEGILGSLGRAVDIVLKRPMDALLHFIILALIVTPVALFVFVLLMAASGVSVGIFGGTFGGYGPFASPAYVMMMAVRSMGAAGASIGIVFAVVTALFALVWLFGYIMAYDSLSAGVVSTAEGRLRGGFSQLKHKVEQYRPTPMAGVAPVAPAQRNCAACGAALASGDQFCGECGHRN